jgi:carbohydrate kinase (thermoresistant glucokinase family)
MVILIVGATGAGKTTVGKLLAQRLNWHFLDADDFHSTANREKMHRGIPLTDADRAPWLVAIHDELMRRKSLNENIVLACSALKQNYRDALSAGLGLQIVYLRATESQLRHNLSGRTDHFAGENLISSQLATLEEPSDALVEDVSHSPDQIVADIITQLHLPAPR